VRGLRMLMRGLLMAVRGALTHRSGPLIATRNTRLAARSNSKINYQLVFMGLSTISTEIEHTFVRYFANSPKFL
jgi:hypothetical protein